MASKGVRFKVWESDTPNARGYFAHMISGNNKITWQSTAGSDGWANKRDAFKTCENTWKDILSTVLNACFKGGKMEYPPCPYTRDSLKPDVYFT